MKVGIVTCSDPKTSHGGGATYAVQAGKALELAGWTAEVGVWSTILPRAIADEYDALLFASLGVNGENGKSSKDSNEARFILLDKVLHKHVPIAANVQACNEHALFRKSYEYWQSRGFPFDLPIITTPSNKAYLAERWNGENRGKEVLLRIPFDVKGTAKKPPKKDHQLVVSSSRLACSKRIHYVMELAGALPKFTFDVYGAEKGVYWYHSLRENPSIGLVNMKGTYRAPIDIYKEAAWAIDLSYMKAGGYVESGRMQYVVIEAMCYGAIPVLFDTWARDWDDLDDGYPFRVVRFPDPAKVGRSEAFDVEAAERILAASEYSIEAATHNVQALVETHDISSLSEAYSNAIGSII